MLLHRVKFRNTGGQRNLFSLKLEVQHRIVLHLFKKDRWDCRTCPLVLSEGIITYCGAVSRFRPEGGRGRTEGKGREEKCLHLCMALEQRRPGNRRGEGSTRSTCTSTSHQGGERPNRNQPTVRGREWQGGDLPWRRLPIVWLWRWGLPEVDPALGAEEPDDDGAGRSRPAMAAA